MIRSNPSPADQGRAAIPQADEDYDIWKHRERWPEAANRIFLLEAVDRIGDAVWGSDDADLMSLREGLIGRDLPAEETGVLADLARFFSRLFVDGALTTFGRPVNGAGTLPLRHHVWEQDGAARAAITGRLAVFDGSGNAEDHWIFLDKDEFDLLLLVHSPAGLDPDDAWGNLKKRHARMVDIVTYNIPLIAATGRYEGSRRSYGQEFRLRSGADPTREELDQMFADAQRVLTPKHQLELIARVEAWLLVRFEEDTQREFMKPQYTALALQLFKPYLTTPLFKEAWRSATATAEDRSRKGRPRKQASRSAGDGAASAAPDKK